MKRCVSAVTIVSRGTIVSAITIVTHAIVSAITGVHAGFAAFTFFKIVPRFKNVPRGTI
jgi:hypothetical protein